VLDYVKSQASSVSCPRNFQDILRAKASLKRNQHIAVVIRCGINKPVAPFIPYVLVSRRVLVIYPSKYSLTANLEKFQPFFDSFGECGFYWSALCEIGLENSFGDSFCEKGVRVNFCSDINSPSVLNSKLVFLDHCVFCQIRDSEELIKDLDNLLGLT